jgi:hypothetical protein
MSASRPFAGVVARAFRPLVAVLLGAAISAGAAAQVPFDTNQPRPNVGDQITLESEALIRPPYDAAPGRYVLAIYVCPGDRATCLADTSRFRRVSITDERGLAVEPRTPYLCTGGRCTVKFRLPRPQKGTATFLAVVYERIADGRFREHARSAGVEVSWVDPPPPPPPPTVGAHPKLILTVEGVTCVVNIGDPGPPENYCRKLSPNGARITINRDGSARPPTFTARTEGYPTETWRIQIYWKSRKFDCTSNPCSFALEGWPPGAFGSPPGDYIGRASVSAGVAWNEKEPRGKDPRTGGILYGVTAEIAVDYHKP